MVVEVLYHPIINPSRVFGEQRCDGQNNLMTSGLDDITVLCLRTVSNHYLLYFF